MFFNLANPLEINWSFADLLLAIRVIYERA